MGKLQVRRGLSSNRPNPLDIGEFGYDTDTKQLWLGAGIVNENIFVAGALATADFSIYVATTALGGRAKSAGADGLKMVSGTATATTANKLVDGAASFDSTHLNKTVYNSIQKKWAKVTAVDSATQLSLSADIMVSGDAYEIANAFDNAPEAWAAIPSPFGANITIRNSSGTFSDAINMVGKTPVGTKTITWQGDATGAGTTISGAVTLNNALIVNDIDFTGTVDTSAVITMNTCTFADVLTCGYGTLLTWTDCTVSKKISTKNGADLTWDNCNTTGSAKLYIQLGSKNLIKNSTVIVGNDPTNITSISSTITTGYTMYMATSALGGDDTVADGLELASGTATSTTANKLVDSGANFTSELLNKTLWNPTDDTWAKVTAVDSPTQLSLSADVMASGEGYVISNAWSTIQGAVDAVPGAFNANTDIKVSNETHSSNFTIQGKKATGNVTLRVLGSKTASVATTALSSATQGNSAAHGTITKTGAGWTVDAYKGMWVYDTTNNEYNLIQSNTADTLKIVGIFTTTPAANFTVYSITSIISGLPVIQQGQLNTKFEFLKITNTGWFYVQSGSYLNLNKCDITNFRARKNSEIFADYSYIHSSLSRVAWVQSNSTINFPRCLIEGGGVNYGVHCDVSSLAGNGDTTFVVDGLTTKPYGVFIQTNATGVFWIPSTDTKSEIRNCTTGLRCQEGGQSIFSLTSVINYSGNTTDTSADAASFGYIS